MWIDSDGGGEAFGYDLRKPDAPVVLVNLVSAGWHEANLQAPSFTEFMAQRERGDEFKLGKRLRVGVGLQPSTTEEGRQDSLPIFATHLGPTSLRACCTTLIRQIGETGCAS